MDSANNPKAFQNHQTSGTDRKYMTIIEFSDNYKETSEMIYLEESSPLVSLLDVENFELHLVPALDLSAASCCI